MLTFFLKGVGLDEKIIFGYVICRENVCDFRMTACDGSGFVKGDNLDFSSLLKGNSIFEKNSVPGPHSVSNHNCDRSGKAKGTGAADHKNGDSSCKGISEFMAGKQPDNGGYNCNCDNSRDKNTGNAVSNLGNWSLGGCSIADHFNDLGECGVLTHTGGFTFDKTRLIYCGCGNKISGSFVNRDAFSCKRGFIHCTGTFDDHTVYRNVFTRAYYEDVSFYHLVNGNCGFAVISDDNSSLWCKLHQALQGICGFSFGTGFQHFSNCDQGKDHSCGFKIEFHHIMHYKLGIAVHLGFGHGEQCVDTPYKGCHGSKGYQSVHIGRAVPEAFKSADKEFLVDDHDNSCQKQLNKPHSDMIAVKPCRKRPSPHHMSH